MTYAPINSQTAYLRTSEVFSEDPSQRLYELTKLTTDIANYVNIREIAQYDLVELINGQQFFDPNTAQRKRQAYRKVFSVGPIATGATLSVNHNIAGFTIFTHIYGTVITDVIDYRPIPYVSATLITDQIAVKITPTQYVITVGATAPNVTSGILILEYLKN